ncbi:hypothetical protein [Bradyrhizobium vignae]|uniref:hypothetical protein n=1 Tax=Bradyrhizobium vignae TaxID=1549949 RepID=UPI0011AE6B83|nr:hypothetical protein [Bradyrhizobium vignae]
MKKLGICRFTLVVSFGLDEVRFGRLSEVGLHLAMRSIVQSNPGEGPQRSVKLKPLTRIASFDTIRPLPTGEVF